MTNTSDFNGFIRTLDGRSDRARYYAAFDLNGDGTITQAEAGTAIVFNQVGNPLGTVNYDRTFQAATGPQETSSKGISFFAQDQVTFNRLTLNVGLRAERWEHFATTGENIYTFDWMWAPRLSAVYDLMGDGRHKVSAYWGRYYDPIRNNMTNFAGTLTGSILEEQIYVLGDWVTYRTRGGAGGAGRVLLADDQDALHRRSADRLRRGPREQHELRRPVLQPPDARHPRGLRPRALCGAARATAAFRTATGAEFAVPRIRLLRLRPEPRLELRHRHAGGRRA